MSCDHGRTGYCHTCQGCLCIVDPTCPAHRDKAALLAVMIELLGASLVKELVLRAEAKARRADTIG
jgi:hypothetical protein